MDSLPVEIIEVIFMFVNPKDYTNFILSYDIALLLWRSETREKYKGQYLRVVRKKFRNKSKIYVVKTIRVDNGKKHGRWANYDESGQIITEITYRNDRFHGGYINYYKNGELRIITMYRNGRLY
jgi:antitoxin component YwqK of YwqJK toxin-antitoxin module